MNAIRKINTIIAFSLSFNSSFLIFFSSFFCNPFCKSSRPFYSKCSLLPSSICVMWKFVGNSESQAFLKPSTSKSAFKQDIYIIYMRSVEGKSKWSYIAKRALSNGARRPLKKCDNECHNPDGVWTLNIYSKFPTYIPSSFELSKMQTCVPSHRAWVQLYLAFCFLLPVHSIPAPEASCCTTILFKVLYCKIKKVSFIFVFIFYVLCEKYYYWTVYTAYYVSWVPRLTLLDLWTNWTYKHTLRMDLRHTLLSYCRQPEDLPNISETHSTYWTCALNNSEQTLSYRQILSCIGACLVTSVVSTSSWPHGCSLPGSSVHGIIQARILEWVFISFSRGSSLHRDWTWVSRIVGRFFIDWTTSKLILILAGQL